MGTFLFLSFGLFALGKLRATRDLRLSQPHRSWQPPVRHHLLAQPWGPHGNCISYVMESFSAVPYIWFHKSDIALEWENHWPVVEHVHVCKVKGGVTWGWMEWAAVCAQKDFKPKVHLEQHILFIHGQQPYLQIVLHDPNFMCFSFTWNNPKQLQDNSMQCTDKEPWVVSHGRARSNPSSPQASITGLQYNILGCLLSACLDPFASPQHSSIHVAWFCLNVLKKTCSYG